MAKSKWVYFVTEDGEIKKAFHSEAEAEAYAENLNDRRIRGEASEDGVDLEDFDDPEDYARFGMGAGCNAFVYRVQLDRLYEEDDITLSDVQGNNEDTFATEEILEAVN